MKTTLKQARLFVFLAVFALTSCSSKETQQESPVLEPTADKHEQIQTGKLPDANPIDFETAYFDYDKAVLRADAKKALKKNVSFLKAHPKTKIQIEGLCDERGSESYNQSLGLKRANAVKRYLVSQGVSADRVDVVSGGKIPGTSESEMAKNRRAGFILIYAGQ